MKLGSTQLAILRCLAENNSGKWHADCGWTWQSAYFTTNVMRKLAKRGLVAEWQVPSTRSAWTYTEWRITPSGREAAKRI